MSVEPPFRVPNPFRDPVRRAAMAFARPAIERALGFPTLNALYLQANREDGRAFAARALDTLGVRYDTDARARELLRTAGPLIVVSNHPFGGIDGLILTDLITRVRPDVRILANELLQRIPAVRELLIPVHAFGRRAATTRNGAALRTAIRWVRGGGVLIVFPAGEVSHASWSEWAATDPPWAPTVGHLVARTRATVVPVHISGSNSPMFQVAGLVHARLRTAMLPREMLKHQGHRVAVQIGTPIPPDELGAIERASEIATYLRVRTYVLAGRNAAKRDGPADVRGGAPIAAAEPARALATEIAGLPPDQCLVSGGEHAVYIASAAQVPAVLREIGRLREIAFRHSGEGTGRPHDLDRFDAAYWHLFLWNQSRREIVGSYRLGPTDTILAASGPAGLYTSTLFRDTGRLAAELNPALELGRSFVRPECQRDYAALLLLWKGIGAFVARHPRYRRLFGSVSISNEYRSMSRQLLIAFLRATRLDADLSRLVRPRNPPPRERPPDWTHLAGSSALSDVDQVDRLVAEIENDRKGVPVLLRHYLKLGAKLLGFNIDHAFGHVLDGLMVVDLLDVPEPVLTRYMGRQGAAAFLAHHRTP